MVDQLEEIKRKVDIVQLINSYVPLKKAGRNFNALCPFHSETAPSFVVSPERQIWHCFGACAEGGDIFRFLMKIENIEFGEALRELAKRAGVKLTTYRPSEGEKEKQILYEVNHLASEYYHYLLLNHRVGKKALDYILGRGIAKESLKLFKLGYAPDAWEGLQQFLVGKKNYPAALLEKAGLIITRGQGRAGPPARGAGFYDRFRGRLMFPLKDHRGNICGFAGRVLAADVPDLPAGRQEPKYINTPETLIYHKSDLLYGLTEAKEAIRKADKVVLVEGELDAISSFQAGVKNIVAIKGSALTPSQVYRLSRHTHNLVLALDADLAGDVAARRGIEVADQAGMNIRVVRIEGYKDPDEVAQKKPQLWQKFISQAIPVYDYFIESAFSRYDSLGAEGKRKIGEELVPVLAKISDQIEQAHYVKLLAGRLNVGEEAVVGQIAKWQPVTEVSSRQSVIQKESSSRRELLEEYLLALCFQSGNWQWLRKRKVILLVKTPRFVSILESLGQYLKRYKTKASERLSRSLPPELMETFNKLYLLDLAEILKDEEKVAKEYQQTLALLANSTVKESLEKLSGKIRNVERKKSLSKQELKQIDKLNEEFRDMTAKLTETTEKE